MTKTASSNRALLIGASGLAVRLLQAFVASPNPAETTGITMTESASSRIFVIDDDVHLLRGVKRMLERQGYLVGVHDGGPGCSSQALRFEPDIVLVDVKMPFLSGDSFVALFGRQGGAARPIVLLYSALDASTLAAMSKECGADGFIPKSDSSLDFARKLASFMRERIAAKEQEAAKARIVH